MPYFRTILIGFALLFCLSSCKHESENDKDVQSFTVAVIVPHDENTLSHYKRVTEWFTENAEKAQEGNDKQYKLNIEWYDEDSENLESLSLQLNNRHDIVSVIGPLESEHVAIVANNLRKSRKNHIAPIASSAELVRSYAGLDFFRSLCETDIAQCEVLLDAALHDEITLVVANSIYGQTFVDWMPFIATEMGKTYNLYQYEDDAQNSELRRTINEALNNMKQNTIIVAPSNYQALQVVQEEVLRTGNVNYNEILYTDIVDDPRIFELPDSLLTNMKGVSIAADPRSGFDVAYQARFLSYENCGESQYYDALLLAFLSAIQADINDDNMNSAMKQIVSGEGAQLIAWNYDGLAREIKAIITGSTLYDISGASSDLNFDTKVQTNVTKSYYNQWLYFEKNLQPLYYFSSDGSLRSYPNMAAWNWNVRKLQDFSETTNITYPERKENWALLIAGSTSWKNYRHQADVLDMYKILKDNGWNDDHIILIIENDIINAAENPRKGYIAVSPDGENLAVPDSCVDYHLTDLTPTDLQYILSGEKTDKIQKVISPTSNDNVLVFWSGHGRPDDLCWNYEQPENSLTTEVFTQILDKMQSKYRKMLWLIETCYSGSVGRCCIGYPGIMCMTAANGYETSKADVYNADMKVWMSNRFTSTITTCWHKNPSMPFRDLYYEVSRQTIGSHVMIYNDQNFDNLFVNGLQEFVVKAD